MRYFALEFSVDELYYKSLINKFGKAKLISKLMKTLNINRI